MHTNSGRSLAVRVGALTAALSLMLAGGVAMASSASAANDNKPDKGNSANSNGNGNNGGSGNTGQGNGGGVGNDNNNGGAIHGDNGPNKNPNNGSDLGGNGSDLNGGTGHVAVTICHATRSAQNPYVLVVSDFSSVDEALLWVQGISKGDKFPDKVTGNGHGDHVGFIWDGQRSGTNWGDIISSVTGIDADGKPMTYYPGYNLDAYSNALESSGRDFLKAGCKTSKPLPQEITKCAALTATPLGAFDEETFVGTQGTPESTWLNTKSQKPLSDYTVSEDGSACGDKNTDSLTQCVALTGPPLGAFSTQEFTGEKGTPTSGWTNGALQPYSAFTVSTNPVVDCGESFAYKASAAPSAPICRVVDGKYTGKGVVVVDPAVAGAGASEDEAKINANKNGEIALLAALSKEATGDNIVPEWKGTYQSFAGYNWNEKTQARFNEGNCSEVLNVITAVPLAGTVAPASGNPKPAKVPTSATLPGAVPAGDGSQVPALPLWALAMVVVGAIGAAAAGSQILGNRK